ncbi:BCCT family transporter [Jeotgalibacillus soli]|uniref:Transporter, betaine/carnitine/choline transporter family protein n=1 Tax=Jeotgalibacillus soli TaxID=889306 RepID=A0A0C2SDQ7_9BACL|nr:BCCT family transporter [Jeotgalibacillus soli]KIL52084.1 transporter, betaine/carnitine/choline transporter family protein [Jeotgalibacillus soli]
MKNSSEKRSLNRVFWISSIVVGILVLIGALAPSLFAAGANAAFKFTTRSFGWLYLLSVFIFVLFLLFLALTRYGRVRLGGDDERPEYPFFTWIGMLFSAGFGVGLVFWGVAEPMSHFFNTPYQSTEPLTEEAARLAMGYSFFHWGVSQWSVFAIVGLIIAYFQFRKKENGLISTSLSPLIKERRYKNTLNQSIDIFAVIATVMGVATSVGLGVLQINGGLNNVLGVPNTPQVQVIIMIVLTALFLTSAVTGIDKGIRWLSNFNLAAALAFMLFVFITGPTIFILETFTLGLGDYLTNFIRYSLRLTPYQGGTWIYDWTVFYWAWAIAWSPFVGAFIARVSRGRTIREFIVGVLIVPPAIALLWIAVFGGTAFHFDLFNGTSIAEAVNNDVTSAIFVTFDQLPLSMITSLFMILLILTFLITSADSATYIISSMTTGGSINPSMFVRIVWGVLIGSIAAVLLVASGLEGLQTASLVSALPFTIILILMVYTLFKLLRKEFPRQKRNKTID